jgi:hypothetical protein
LSASSSTFSMVADFPHTTTETFSANGASFPPSCTESLFPAWTWDSGASEVNGSSVLSLNCPGKIASGTSGGFSMGLLRVAGKENSAGTGTPGSYFLCTNRYFSASYRYYGSFSSVSVEW